MFAARIYIIGLANIYKKKLIYVHALGCVFMIVSGWKLLDTVCWRYVLFEALWSAEVPNACSLSFGLCLKLVSSGHQFPLAGSIKTCLCLLFACDWGRSHVQPPSSLLEEQSLKVPLDLDGPLVLEAP